MSDKQDGDWDFVIHSYSLEDALADGVLHKLWEAHWHFMSGGKPIVMTDHVYRKVWIDDLVLLWNEYVAWCMNVRDTLPEEEQMFVDKFNGDDIWILEDGASFCVMFPEDY